jgi:hypothetical protein
MRRWGGNKPLHIVEIGGANSCFVDKILAGVRPARYHIIDNNRYGLDLLQNRNFQSAGVSWALGDVLDLPSQPFADVVYSVGLVEHFDPSQTAEAIRGHFRLAKEGGYVIISFPTPTWLYRITRTVVEAAGMWKFPDERPLMRDEVALVMSQYGDIIWEKTLWPLVFTQHMIVVRKSTPIK